MKKFFILFAALAILSSGCFKQSEVKKPGNPTETWIPGTAATPTADGIPESKSTAKVETGETTTVESKVETTHAAPAPQPVAKAPPPTTASAPAPKPLPPPAPQPREATLPVFNAGVPGGPSMPVALVEGDYAVEEYRPMVHSWSPGWMLRVDNNTDRYKLVSSAGSIPIYRMNGQGHLFAVRTDRDSNRQVILLKPGMSAQFVVDGNMCPPNGARCAVTVQIASYSTTQPRVKRLARTITRTVYFTGEDRVGQFLAIR